MQKNGNQIKKIAGIVISIIAVVVAVYKIIEVKIEKDKEIRETQAAIAKIEEQNQNQERAQSIADKARAEAQQKSETEEKSNENGEQTNSTEKQEGSNTEKQEQSNTKTETPQNTSTESSRKATTNKNVIVIDPGHQTKGNSEKEPIGPGATETKAKVTGGATGVSTGKTEYQLNLEVALKVRDILESNGYTVIMTRTTNNVNLSNSERAQIANDAGAAAFVRIHANSVDSSSVKGVLTMCQTSSNKYNGELADESYKLSRAVLNNFVKTTGANNKGVTRTDTMSGINWCKVPTTIVEMGFMSNPEEDELMATEEYQDKMANGIASGIMEFLEN